jgi:hypothetical protein
MTSNPPMSLDTPKTEDKAAALARFISANLVSGSVITVVARSADSPVAHALVQLGKLLAAREVMVRAIFTTVATNDLGGWCTDDSALPFKRDVRWARNPRFIEAHEQLVLSTEACWLGDSMRRDPSKRDAFEQTKTNCAATATLAASSFERLSRVSEPMAMRTPRRPLEPPTMIDVVPPVAMERDQVEGAYKA